MKKKLTYIDVANFQSQMKSEVNGVLKREPMKLANSTGMK